MRRAYRRVGLASVAVLLVLAACVGPRSFMGPVTGRVELADATALPDEEVVVYLRCSSYALHGTWPSDRESRVVAPGERFLFLWAYRGLAPAACTVQVIHPLHHSGYARLRGGLRETLPPFQLESFDVYLTRGPGPDERQERWATQAFTSHLSAVDHHFVPALSQTLRRERFVHYMPELQRLFERVRERDGFGPWTP